MAAILCVGVVVWYVAFIFGVDFLRRVKERHRAKEREREQQPGDGQTKFKTQCYADHCATMTMTTTMLECDIK